jgi:hypothetical protein
MTFRNKFIAGLCFLGVLCLPLVTTSHAGFILSGTDSDDHGSVTGTTNNDGWLFMQKALENLATTTTNGNTVVTVLGSTSGALTAATSAFNQSGIAGSFTLQVIATSDFADFFSNSGAFASSGVSASGILMMDSGSNVGGGVSGSSFDSYATQIDTFLSAGGSLLSQGNGYSWVNVLLPTLAIVDVGGGGTGTSLSLTAAGNTAFPGLTDGDLSTGPWHNHFTVTAGLPVLATEDGNGLNVILGSSGGGIINPGPTTPPPTPGVPDSGTSLQLLGLGMITMVFLRRRFLK